MVEHSPYKRGVTGSNPVPPTSQNKPRSDHATGLRAIDVPLALGSDASFEAEPDLAERHEEILRSDMGC